MGVKSSTRELLVADTSFISMWHAAAAMRDPVATWPRDVMSRIEASALSISVVTLAELRAGHLKARWGERRRGQTERWLRQFAQFPVDHPVADAWSVLKEGTRRRGITCSENDLWIAATGHARGAPVITCDRGFVQVRELGVDVVYLPRRLPVRYAERR